jgi:hypothetical protein
MSSAKSFSFEQVFGVIEDSSQTLIASKRLISRSFAKSDKFLTVVSPIARFGMLITLLKL